MSARKVALFMVVTLDGFFDGPNHELLWHHVDADFEDFAAKQLNAADVLLFGRKTYQLMADFWPSDTGKKNSTEIAALMNGMPKIVFSKTLSAPGWQNVRLIKDHAAEEVRKLTAQPGKDLLVLGSNNFSVSLFEMGLVDEVRLMLNPVVLGRGHSIFSGLSQKSELRLAATREFRSGNILLTYRKR